MEQHDDIGSVKDLVLYRIESAKEDLSSANILFEANAYKAANNLLLVKRKQRNRYR